MRVSYKMTEAELMSFNMFRATRKNAYILPMALMIACGALALMSIFGIIAKVSWWLYPIFFAGGALVFLIIYLFLRNRMKHSVKVMMFRQKKEDLMPQTSVTLEEDYFEVYTVNRDSEINYDSVERIELGKEFVYLELDANGEVGIPIRAFDSKQEMDDFLRYFIERTPDAQHVGVDYIKKEL